MGHDCAPIATNGLLICEHMLALKHTMGTSIDKKKFRYGSEEMISTGMSMTAKYPQTDFGRSLKGK